MMFLRRTQTLASRLHPITTTQIIIRPHPDTPVTTFRREFGRNTAKNGFFRRFQSMTSKTGYRPIPDFKSMLMIEKILGRIKPEPVKNLQVLPKLDQKMAQVKAEPVHMDHVMTVKDAKKVLRVAQLEMVKKSLRRKAEMRSCIGYAEFLKVCVDGSSKEQGVGLARCLDDSGVVIVLGNKVFLRPEQVTRAIEGIIPLSMAPPNDPRREELAKMEEVKSVIDEKANAMVRKELWTGLGFLVVQTAAFMRLTFWELSWDVMEPVCFYVTSGYFMAGYTFFLRTAKEPCFEGFFNSRFSAKQKQLMKVHKFDMNRYNELRHACYPCSFASEPPDATVVPKFHHDSSRVLMGAPS